MNEPYGQPPITYGIKDGSLDECRKESTGLVLVEPRRELCTRGGGGGLVGGGGWGGELGRSSQIGVCERALNLSDCLLEPDVRPTRVSQSGVERRQQSTPVDRLLLKVGVESANEQCITRFLD